MATLNYQHAALRQYQSMDVASEVYIASPHKLIEMLLVGALARIARARGAIARKDIGLKIESILSASAIIENLLMSLDVNAGGDIARNLTSLYDYMLRRLVYANAHNDIAALEEVSRLLGEIKSAWDAIPINLRGASVS